MLETKTDMTALAIRANDTQTALARNYFTRPEICLPSPQTIIYNNSQTIRFLLVIS